MEIIVILLTGWIVAKLRKKSAGKGGRPVNYPKDARPENGGFGPGVYFTSDSYGTLMDYPANGYGLSDDPVVDELMFLDCIDIDDD